MRVACGHSRYARIVQFPRLAVATLKLTNAAYLPIELFRSSALVSKISGSFLLRWKRKLSVCMFAPLH